MKIRKDFVTNSSSTAFIIVTNEEVPEDFAGYVQQVHLDTFLEEMKYQIDTYWLTDTFMDNCQRVLDLTDKQRMLIHLLMGLEDKEEILEAIDRASAGEKVYTVDMDRDVFFRWPELEAFVRRAEIIRWDTDA